jgi:hypothetical protein
VLGMPETRRMHVAASSNSPGLGSGSATRSTDASTQGVICSSSSIRYTPTLNICSGPPGKGRRNDVLHNINDYSIRACSTDAFAGRNLTSMKSGARGILHNIPLPPECPAITPGFVLTRATTAHDCLALAIAVGGPMLRWCGHSFPEDTGGGALPA